MRVFVKWEDKDGIHEEVTDLINQEEVYIMGTSISIPTGKLGGEMMLFEDEQGLWGLKKEEILELRRLDTEPSDN